MAMFTPEPVAPEPGPVVRPRSPQPPKRSLASTLILGLAAVVAVGGLAFAAGRLTAPVAAATTGFDRNGTGANGTGENGFGNGNGFPRPSGAVGGLGGFRGAGGFGIRGTVTAITADQLTIQLTNGSTISIPLSSSTTYHQQAAATAADVQVGSQVQVQLSRNGTASGNPGAPASPGAGTSGAPQLGTASDVTVLGK